MQEPLNRSDNPPPRGPKDWVFRVRPGEGFAGQIYSIAVWGVWTHWDGKATRECLKDSRLCPRCKEGAPSRWRGYLHVWNSVAKEEQFLELTGDAVEEIWRQIGKGTSLRGLLLRMRRHGQNIRGCLVVELSAFVGDVDTLPAPRDPEKTLRLLWQWIKNR